MNISLKKAFDDLHSHSEHYRCKCAEIALQRSRINKLLELISFASSALIVAILSAALSGFIASTPAQQLALILSCLTALLNAIIKSFFNPEMIVKLFYVAGEFLEIRERAAKLKLQCKVLNNDELSAEYHNLNDDYISLKKAYIEYMRTSSYRGDRRRRKIRVFKILAKKFTELPPIRGRSNRK